MTAATVASMSTSTRQPASMVLKPSSITASPMASGFSSRWRRPTGGRRISTSRILTATSSASAAIKWRWCNEMTMHRWTRSIYLTGIVSLVVLPLTAQSLPYEAMAARIVAALQVTRGERVLLRVDPNNMAALAPIVQAQLQASGAVVETLPYGPAPDFEARLARTDVYVWLPAPASATPVDQARALQRWIENGEGRELHFHWIDGTRDVDGLPAKHTPAYDRVYVEALEIDYKQLGIRMNAAIQKLRSAEVQVTTPAGTNLRFRVGDRPFNKQDGDASKAHARTGRIRIDRHTELPAGILRVAPLEETVTGVLVLPSARFGSQQATDVRLEFQNGVVTSARARSGNDGVQAFLKSDPAAPRFREFCLGFNPRLVVPAGESALPYYGYGAGVVRMSLGDNSELGGSVRGGGVRWLFFPDATVTASGASLVTAGKLVQSAPRTGSESVQSALRTGSASVQNRLRTGSARDLGIPLDGTTGPHNAITDIAGIEVGMTTLIAGEGPLKRGAGPVRTGVTAILPRGKTFDPVF